MPEPPDAVLTSASAQRAGGELFGTYCVICHGASGDGRGLRQNAMAPPPANLTLPPWSQPDKAARTFVTIRQGVPGTAMAPWPTLSDEQIWQLVAYIETLHASR